MVPCEAFWHMDTTNFNLSKNGSKIIAMHFSKHEIAYWKHVLHLNQKEVKNENPGIL